MLSIFDKILFETIDVALFCFVFYLFICLFESNLYSLLASVPICKMEINFIYMFYIKFHT